MHSKIQKLGELENVLCNNEKVSEGVLSLFSSFQISSLLRPFDEIKEKGFKVSTIIMVLCLYRLQGLSVWAMHKSGYSQFFKGDENSIYRFMNHSFMNWRKLLLSFARQFVKITAAKGDGCRGKKCFILDDSDIEKTGSTIEFISRIFNHVIGKHVLGFKLLALGYWDGKSLIATDFSLHREKGKNGNYGLSKKERKRQFSKSRNTKTPGSKRVKELDQKKTQVAVSMIKRAVKNGLSASYVLMDTWFTHEYIISSIRSIKEGMLHIIGMCRMDNRKYLVDGKELNSKQIITRYERKKGKYSRKYKSRYITIVADYKGEKVKLFYIKYRNAKDWRLLLTTDLTLKFTGAVELYQIRWSIEVLFKECKQYLRLGECQNTDFDGQIADVTLTLITHTILTLQKRFEAYETMGELFRETQQHLLELTLWERILKVFIKMIQQLMELFNIDIDEMIEKILNQDQVSRQILIVLKTLEENEDNGEIFEKIAA